MTRRRLRSSLTLVACALVACAREAAVRSFDVGDLTVRHVVAPAPLRTSDPDAATMAVYLTIENRGAVDDTLYAVDSPVAGMTMLHATVSGRGMASMIMMPAVVVPAHEQARLAPGATHAMLEHLRRAIGVGDSVPLTLHFRRAGRLDVSARVVAYAALDSALGIAERR